MLDQCQSERARFQGLGGAILTTAGIAAVSMTFALVSALKVFPLLAVPVGLAWGFAILSLDRWLVASLPALGGRRFTLALPRVLLALLLGVVISTPLVLQIFKPEIDAKLIEMQRQRGDEFVLAQQSGGVGQRIARLEQSAASLQKVITSGGEKALDPADDSRMQELTASRKKAQADQDKYFEEWQCQLYVGPPKCAKKGDGPLAREAEAEFNAARERVKKIDRDMSGRRSELASADKAGKETRLAQATEDLGAVRRELATLYAQRNDLRGKFAKENTDSDGLLLRLEALDEVSKDNAGLNTARILLFLFFLLIECLPVMVKLMQRPGAYDRILAAKERQETASAIDEIRAAARPRPRSAWTNGPTRSFVAAEPRTTTYTETEPIATNAPPPDDGEHDGWEHRALRDLRDDRAARLASARSDHSRSSDDW